MSPGVGSLHWNPGAIVADFEPQAGSGKPPKTGKVLDDHLFLIIVEVYCIMTVESEV